MNKSFIHFEENPTELQLQIQASSSNYVKSNLVLQIVFPTFEVSVLFSPIYVCYKSTCYWRKSLKHRREINQDSFQNLNLSFLTRKCRGKYLVLLLRLLKIIQISDVFMESHWIIFREPFFVFFLLYHLMMQKPQIKTSISLLICIFIKQILSQYTLVIYPSNSMNSP